MNPIRLTDVSTSPEGQLINVIYCVTNVVNGKCYVGKTSSTLNRRISGHVYDALHKDSRYAFHAAIRKHGLDAFVVEVLDTCASLEELRVKEIERIDEKSSYTSGYNMTRGGEGIDGFRHTADTKRVISVMKKGRPLADASRRKLLKPVLQVDLASDVIISRFESIMAAHAATGVSNIGMCCRGKIKAAGGFRWRYEDSSHAMKGTWHPKKREAMTDRLASGTHNDKPVLQVDVTTGETLAEFASVKEAALATGATNISSVCRGIRKSSGGFVWRFKLDQSPV